VCPLPIAVHKKLKMKISKAVITVAGPQQNRLPLQRFVDLDGCEKSALEIVIEEVVAAHVEQIALVIRPGDEGLYAEAAGNYESLLTFVVQPDSRGYGEAIFRAAEFVGDESFLHLVGDHLYISSESRRCAQQLVELARAEECVVSAVQPTRENRLFQYGTIGGRPVSGRKGLYEVENILEKPTPTEAEQHLIVPGQRAGHYLCLFGMHVLTATVMEILREIIETDGDESVGLTPALAKVSIRERYLATELQGTRYNIGVKYGLLTTQLALALRGDEREEVLAQLVELLTNRAGR
jgi:UTP--glucose-1-phosphate uridylyltransferase